MLREALPGAVQAVIDVLNDPEAKPAERLTAAKIVLDRVLGKAVQPIETEITTTAPMSLREKEARLRELLREFADEERGERIE